MPANGRYIYVILFSSREQKNKTKINRPHCPYLIPNDDDSTTKGVDIVDCIRYSMTIMLAMRSLLLIV